MRRLLFFMSSLEQFIILIYLMLQRTNIHGFSKSIICICRRGTRSYRAPGAFERRQSRLLTVIHFIIIGDNINIFDYISIIRGR